RKTTRRGHLRRRVPCHRHLRRVLGGRGPSLAGTAAMDGRGWPKPHAFYNCPCYPGMRAVRCRPVLFKPTGSVPMFDKQLPWYRVGREGMRTGERINACTIEAQWWLMLRLMCIVDDYLIWENHPMLCLARACSLMAANGQVTPDQVRKWNDELEAANLIRKSDHDGRQYGIIVEVELQTMPNGKRVTKYPHPPKNIAWLDVAANKWRFGARAMWEAIPDVNP